MRSSESRTEAIACELLTIRGWNTARPPKGNILGETGQWWSPDSASGYFWPADVPKKPEVKSFVKLYERQGGYSTCPHSRLEKVFEKIAIYANTNGEATHVAKQTESGRWTSKLGDWEDIEHNTLAALEGEFYGKAVQILKRAVT